MNRTRSDRWVWAAGILWSALFLLTRLGWVDFWWGMSTISASVASIGLAAEPSLRRELVEEVQRDAWRSITEGVALAGSLYMVFWVGHHMVRYVGMGGGVESVYRLAEGVSLFRIAAQLLLVIGPAEEIVWRGLVQRRWTRSNSRVGVWKATALYCAVHVPTGNPVLVLAAAVAGAVWGIWYHWRRRLWVNIVSHALWDVLVFVAFPFRA